MKIKIPISAGELVDKLTILELKSVMIKDEVKLAEVQKEKEQLTAELNKFIKSKKLELFTSKADLYEVNFTLWKIEDKIRGCERNKDFGEAFIQLARDVYHRNDMRFKIKNYINQLTNSDIKEVKSYESYS